MRTQNDTKSAQLLTPAKQFAQFTQLRTCSRLQQAEKVTHNRHVREKKPKLLTDNSLVAPQDGDVRRDDGQNG
jgi:hypothetical protein